MTRPPALPVFQPAGTPRVDPRTVRVICPSCGGTETRDSSGRVKAHNEWVMGRGGVKQGDQPCPGGRLKPEQHD